MLYQQSYMKDLYTSILNEKSEIIEQMAFELLRKGKPTYTIAEEVSQKLGIASEIIYDTVSSFCSRHEVFSGFDFLHAAFQWKIYSNFFYPNLIRNVRTGRLENGEEDVEEAGLNTIRLRANIFGIEKRFKKGDFIDIINSEFTANYDPLIDFFERNKNRKPTDTIKQLVSSIKTPTGSETHPEYTELFLTKWLVGIVASIFGDFNNLFIIFVGRPNTGKTEFFMRLMPKELLRFCSEAKVLRLKTEADVGMTMCENILVGDDELAGKTGADWRDLKGLCDKIVFTTRKPYGTGFTRSKRIASLWGTTNEFELLGDPTGNRRLIPVEVKDIDKELYNSIDKTDLLMECFWLYQENKFFHKLSTSDIKILNDCTENFEMSDPVSESILLVFEVPNGSLRSQELTPTEIVQKIRHYTGQNISTKAIGVRMKKIGFEQKFVARLNPNGIKSTIRKYIVVEKAENGFDSEGQKNYGYGNSTISQTDSPPF
ncbi:MAG: hypothetical protein H7Y04_11645 [Verrucomicrobia bacterium]|nr:hypothetical protein [Cytophagales bacterium]